MRSDGVRIIKSTAAFSGFSGGYDTSHGYMYGYELDLARKTAVLMRQSRKGGDQLNPESRLRQEGLVRVAVDIRADHDPLMIIPCDEGSGVSGQKKIYERPKLLELWVGIQNGTIGSVIVAREDRLFRDRFLTQVTQFAEECARRGVLVIVAGRRSYDFRISDDFNAFIRKMQEAYGYIDTHVKYMQQMLQQKLARGEWVGGGIIAPYALDKIAIAAAREQRRALKEFGSSEEDELIISRAYRPVIYEQWQPIAIELFEKFKLFDYSRSRMCRYVEERKYIFPFPHSEDLQRYFFNVRMGSVTGLGYTFSDGSRLLGWFSNLMHIGYASAGKDDNGNRVYIEGAFDAAIPRDLFEPSYEAITGFTLDGKASTVMPNTSRFVRKRNDRSNAIPMSRFRSPEKDVRLRADFDPPDVTYYAAYRSLAHKHGEGLSYLESNRLWSLPTAQFDAAIVERLAALSSHDREIADRVEKYYKELTESKESEKATIIHDIGQLEALIAHYDRIIHNPARPLTVSQEARSLETQAKVEADLEKAQAALLRYERSQPTEFIPAFYRILGEVPNEFWSLDVDRQRHMLGMLIDEIQITNLSPHLYKMLLKWKDPIAHRWDCAIIFKRQAVRTKLAGVSEWSDEEDELLRRIWPASDKLDLYKAFPTKTGDSIKARATMLKVKRNERMPATCSIIHRALAYEDWAQACVALGAEQEGDEGRKILKMLNYYGRITEKQSMLAAFWWIMPVVEMNAIEERWVYQAPPAPYLT